MIENSAENIILEGAENTTQSIDETAGSPEITTSYTPVLQIDPEFKVLVPPQSKEEHALLEDSLIKNGYDRAYPIIVWNNTILDGHNRHEICQKHNIQFETIEKQFNSKHDAMNWIIDNQLSRRNLTDNQRAYLIGKRYREEKKDKQDNLNHGQVSPIGHSDPSEPTAQKIAEQVSVSDSTVKRAGRFADAVDEVARNAGINPQIILSDEIRATQKDIKAVSEIAPDYQKKVFEKIEQNEARNVKDALRKVREDIIEIKKADDVLPVEFQFINRDFKDEWQNMTKESVDFIITEPPYKEEHLPPFEELAKCADSVLKPGGSLLVMVSQSHLPEALKLMTPYLQYHWTLSYQTPVSQSVQIHQKKVNTFWKPVLWFVKGEYKGECIGDVIRSKLNDKRFPEMGRSEKGMLEMMQRFVSPDSIVFDPLMGSGTTGVVCKELQCQFIGIEADKVAFDTAMVRLGGK